MTLSKESERDPSTSLRMTVEMGNRSLETAPTGNRSLETAPTGNRSLETAPTGNRSLETAPTGNRIYRRANSRTSFVSRLPVLPAALPLVILASISL